MRLTHNFLLPLFLLLISCNTKTKENTMIELVPRENVKFLLDSIVENEYPKDSLINEIFINRTMPCNTEIILHRGQNSRAGRKPVSPIAYTHINGIKFNIYSGIEYYFSSSTEQDIDTETNSIQDSAMDLIWIINDSCGVITMKSFNNNATKKFKPLV